MKMSTMTDSLTVLEPASEAVLETIPAAAGASLKRVTLELGGKSPNIVFADADADADLEAAAAAAREEIFGPVAVAIGFEDEADAVRLANDTIYGLSGSIWSRDGARALRVARALDAGVLSINSNTSVRVATPFGGFKQSGYGRELGPHALDAYTEEKSIFYSTEG